MRGEELPDLLIVVLYGEVGEGVREIPRQLLDLHALRDELLTIGHFTLQGLIDVDEVDVHAHQRKAEDGEHVQESEPGCLGRRVGHEHHSYPLPRGGARRMAITCSPAELRSPTSGYSLVEAP